MNDVLRRSLPVQLLSGACNILEPRPSLEVWEWAERRVILSPRITRFSGPLSFVPTPYMIGEWSPLWAYRRYQQIDNIWAAQTGKTLMLCVTVLYDTEIDPGPGMIVYPDRPTAVRRSRRLLRPLIEDSMPEYLLGGQEDFQLLEYNLSTCSWVLGWAGSPSILSGEPIKHLKMDEEAKFAGATTKEADAKRLALRRTISFGEFGNSFSCTTPSLHFLPGWRDWKQSTKAQRHVRCPECGTWQVMYFSNEDRRLFHGTEEREWLGGIKWDRDPNLTREQRTQTAFYQCENRDCQDHWTSAKKNWLVSNASEWIAQDREARKYASHLASWYSQWVPFSDVVDRWFDCYKDDEARHDFLNSDAAVPYEIAGKQADPEMLKRHKLLGHHRMTVPEEATAVYLTVDVHDDHLRYRVRAWAPDMTSWGVEEGQLPPDLGVVDDFLHSRTYRGANGDVPISYGLIDSGYRTDEVYQLCLRNHGRIWPCRGVAYLKELVQYSKQNVIPDPEKGVILGGDVILVNANDHRWKDQLFSRWEVQLGTPGAWYVEEEASRAYYEQLTGEVKVEKKSSTGHPSFEWRLVHDNHAFDCEKMQLVACIAFQLTSSRRNRDRPTPAETKYNPYTGREIGKGIR